MRWEYWKKQDGIIKKNSDSWLFRKSEPKNMRFAVTFIATARSLEADREEELSDYCTAAGWRKVARWGNSQMQIFATENPQAVPLETDESARLDNIWGIISKKFLGPFGACAVLWIGIALMNIYGILSHPDMVEPGRWIIVFMQLYVAAVLLGRSRNLRFVKKPQAQTPVFLCL